MNGLLAVLLILAAAPAQAASGPSAMSASDAEIDAALWKLLREEPQRTVCAERTITGSRQPRQVCATVERWFDARHPRDVASERAPWQLVAEIKKNRNEARRQAR